MQRALLFKIAVILGLTVLISVALAMIHATIEERAQFRQGAIDSIAKTNVREQTLTGPILLVRYTDEYEEEDTVSEGTESKKQLVARSVEKTHLVFPDELFIDSAFDTDRRHRGIHQVLVYSGKHKLSGHFVVPALADLPRASPKSRIKPGRASIALGVSDGRGILNIPTITLDGQVAQFQQATEMTVIPSGVHADLAPLAMEQPAKMGFSMTLGLDGIERQNFVPVGKNNKVKAKSAWPHPQFGGDFLPSVRDRTIDDDGFSASWQVSSLSTTAQQQILDRENGVAKDGPRAGLESFSIGFVEPVNVYSLAERATKYGLLFIALTFAAFFMFEILKRLPIHPIQYLLVGLALAIFFLLLVSLSEHIRFVLAYLIASGACILLLGFYLSFVLRDWKRGLSFAVALTALYGALYGLLISESNALVLGSILLFSMLAAVMVATRKIDWYGIGKAEVRAA